MRAVPITKPHIAALDVDLAWSLLLALRAAVRQAESIPDRLGLGRAADGAPAVLGPVDRHALITVEADGVWTPRAALDPAAASMVDLYLPLALARAGRPVVVGHLGISLDGQIATGDGISQYITGPENIRHLHRMRALADAVVVGAATAALDDPRLTTRQVPGDSPVRVVIDAERRLDRRLRIFSDGAAETLLFCAADRAEAEAGRHGRARVVGVPAGPNGLSLDTLLAELRARGLHGILVEGGGVTVSRFLSEGRLDRLHLAVAPLITGSGRPGLKLPPLGDLAQAMRPRCRHFPMGQDILFDCDLRAEQ